MQDLTRYLAIDYGFKRVGLAVSDPLKIIASPLCVIENNEKLLDNLDSLIKEKNIGLLILGYPLKEDGTPTTITESVLKFKGLLEKRFNMQVKLVDERYSSAIALDRVRESVTSRKKRRNKGLVDMNAAAILLEDYLQSLSP